MSYTVGQQPCQNFRAQDALFNGSGNAHECLAPFDGSRLCTSTVSFCENCNRDHHRDGYESCGAQAALAQMKEQQP